MTETNDVEIESTTVEEGVALWKKAKAFLRHHSNQDESFADDLDQAAVDVPDETLEVAFGKNYARERLTIQIKRALLKARKRAGMTQGDVAARLNILQPAVSRIENVNSISIRSLADYLQACGYVADISIRPMAS